MLLCGVIILCDGETSVGDFLDHLSILELLKIGKRYFNMPYDREKSKFVGKLCLRDNGMRFCLCVCSVTTCATVRCDNLLRWRNVGRRFS